MGGALAWELASADHETQQLVLIDALLGPPGKPLLSMLLGWLVDKSEDIIQMYRRKSKATLEQLGVGIRGPRIVSLFRFWRVVKTIKITQSNLVGNLRVLALWGSCDHLVPLQDYVNILNQPAIKIMTYPGGHYWFGWHEKELLSDLENFIENNPLKKK